MGLLDWIRARFSGRPKEASTEENFFSDEPLEQRPTPQSAAKPKAEAKPRAEARPVAAKPKVEARPVAAKPKAEVKPKPEAKPKPETKARPEAKPEPKRKARRPQPNEPAGSSEVLSVAEAERRYGALVAPPPPPPKPARAPRPKPPPPAPVEAAPPPPPPAADLPEGPPPPPAVSEEATRRRAEAQEHRRLAALPHFQALLQRADALLAIDDVDPRHLLAMKRDLLDQWRALGPLPESHAEDLVAGQKRRLDALSARAQVVFDARDQERQANLAKKRALLAELEALSHTDDLRAVGPELARIRQAWREVGPVPKDASEALNAALDAARSRLDGRRAAARAATDAARADGIAALERLVMQAEALVTARDAEGAAERAKALQATWKTVRVPGRREETDALWTRFRAACDQIFQRRAEAVAAARQANLARKEALIARALALAEGEPVADPDGAVRGLMADWKRTGPAPRELQDELWARFKAACDALRAPPPLDDAAAGDKDALVFQPFATLKQER